MSEWKILDYQTQIQPGCKLLDVNTLCAINKEVLPYGMVIFSQMPISHWQNEPAPQENFVRLVVELYAVLYDYGKKMTFALIKDRHFANKTYKRIDALRHYFCHGLSPKNNTVYIAQDAIADYTGASRAKDGSVCPSPEEWAHGVDALLNDSNKLAETLLQSVALVKNQPTILSSFWKKRWNEESVAQLLKDGGCKDSFSDICEVLEQSGVALENVVSQILIRAWQDDSNVLLGKKLWNAEIEGLLYWYENELNAVKFY